MPRSRLFRAAGVALRLPVLLAVTAATALAAAPPANPWTTAINNLMTAFTGPIGRGLSLVAIVITGLMFAFGEPGGKKALAGVLFGLSMVMGAAGWLTWLTT